MVEALGFGQRIGSVVQTAFVVAVIHAAIAHYQRDCGAGPFFLLDHFLGEDQIYRGEVSSADVAIAMGFVGHMQIELIQPLDDHPSIYRETIEQRGHGFHHFGVAFADVDAVLPDYLGRGHRLVFRAPVPTGGAVAYLESADPAAPGFLELIPATGGMNSLFTAQWQAAQDWDGQTAPVRPFL